jgi:hypothetical protein
MVKQKFNVSMITINCIFSTFYKKGFGNLNFSYKIEILLDEFDFVVKNQFGDIYEGRYSRMIEPEELSVVIKGLTSRHLENIKGAINKDVK